MSGKRGSGSKTPLPPLHEGFEKGDERRDAAAAEYGKQLASLDLDALDLGIDPVETPKQAPAPAPRDQARALGPDATERPNLEPVGDDAHPPQNRRMPTQPPSALVLDLGDDDRPLPRRKAETSRPPSKPTSSSGPEDKLPAPRLSPRQSPAPVRRKLFSIDRVTNLLAGVAVGLLVMIFPAQKIAHSYEVREVEPLLADLEGAIEHPLGVQAGLVRPPEAIAAQIHAGRKKARRRYGVVWLLFGLPLGLGLAFAPRPGD